MKRLALVMLLFITSACTPAERLVWDSLHGLPAGRTHEVICELEPDDPYCGVNDFPEPAVLTQHDILWNAINETFPVSEHATARRVATCESGDNRNFTSINMYAKSRTNDHGPFQINATVWNKSWHSDPVAQFIGGNWHGVYDPVTNTQMAYRIWAKYGWGKWACY